MITGIRCYVRNVNKIVITLSFYIHIFPTICSYFKIGVLNNEKK